MDSIITNTDVQTKEETIPDKGRTLILPIKKEVIKYDVCYAGYSDWDIEADEIEYVGQVVIFKLKGKVNFIAGTAHLLYINEKEE